jgi:preprotein translocase subunit SecG
MYQILVSVHIFVCVVLIALVVLQQGKGAEAGAAFGSGASQTVFGSQGSATFLTKSTAMFATLFFLICLGLTYLTVQANKKASTLDLSTVPQQKELDLKQKSTGPINPDVPSLPTTQKPE